MRMWRIGRIARVGTRIRDVRGWMRMDEDPTFRCQVLVTSHRTSMISVGLGGSMQTDPPTNWHPHGRQKKKGEHPQNQPTEQEDSQVGVSSLQTNPCGGSMVTNQAARARAKETRGVHFHVEGGPYAMHTNWDVAWATLVFLRIKRWLKSPHLSIHRPSPIGRGGARDGDPCVKKREKSQCRISRNS